jgi:raffinose/stachyose/melibiose transport system permease protein
MPATTTTAASQGTASPPGRVRGSVRARKRRRWSPGRTTLLILAALPFLYPFAFLVGTALKPNSEFVANEVNFPSHPTFANFSSAWTQADLGAGMLHSAIAVGVGVVLTVLISASSGFWFLMHQGRAAAALRIILIGTMALPPPVFIIPLFVLLSDWHLSNNLIVLGCVYAAWNGSFGLYLTYAYYQRAIPEEVLEASRIDGAARWAQFRRIVLPLSKPAMATIAVLAFVWSWSDLLLAIVLIQNPAQRTLIPATTLLTNRYNTDLPANAAAVVLALLPMLIVFLGGQRFLQRGILAGVGK